MEARPPAPGLGRGPWCPLTALATPAPALSCGSRAGRGGGQRPSKPPASRGGLGSRGPSAPCGSLTRVQGGVASWLSPMSRVTVGRWRDSSARSAGRPQASWRLAVPPAALTMAPEEEAESRRPRPLHLRGEASQRPPPASETRCSGARAAAVAGDREGQGGEGEVSDPPPARGCRTQASRPGRTEAGDPPPAPAQGRRTGTPGLPSPRGAAEAAPAAGTGPGGGACGQPGPSAPTSPAGLRAVPLRGCTLLPGGSCPWQPPTPAWRGCSRQLRRRQELR